MNLEIALTKEACLACGKLIDGPIIINSILTEKAANEIKQIHGKCIGYSEYTTVIDTNQLDGDVMEIPYEEYKEWWDNNYHCLGVTGL